VDGPARHLRGVRRVLLTLFALIAAVMAGALWYAYEKGFTSKWRNYVTEEFRKRGVEVTLRHLTLDPMRGLVAKEVQIFDAKDRRRTLAVINEMALQVNFSNLVRGNPFLDALELRDANLSLPLNPEKPRGPKIEIAHLNARLFLPPQQIYLAHADAEIFGLHVTAAGRLIHPEAFRLKFGSREAISPDLVARIFDEINGLKADSEPPVANVTFSGDLAEPDQIFVEVAFWGERLHRQNYALRSLYLAASYRGGVLDLKQLQAVDTAGELRLSGLWEPAAHKARLQLRSSLDAPAMVRSGIDVPWLTDFVFYVPPHMDLRCDLALGDKIGFHLSGHVDASKFAYRSVVFDGATGDFSWDGDRWSARDVRLMRAGGEELTGDALAVPGDFRAQLRSTINPKDLRPLVTGKLVETLTLFDFPHAPVVTLKARGAAPELESVVISGEVSLLSASFRGVPADNAKAEVRYENQVLSIAPLHIERPEGHADGNLYYDFGRGELRLDEVLARVNLPEVAMWMDSKLVKDLLPYRFASPPPELRVNGIVDLQHGKTTHLAIDIDAPAGMEYTFLQKKLSAAPVSAKLLFTDDRLKISGLSAGLFDGSLKGDADVSLLPGQPGDRGSLTLENLDFAGLTKLFFDRDSAHGRLNGHYEFTSRGDDARKMDGRGELAVADGNVFAVPFLAPLTGVLDSIAPGLGRAVPDRASASFTISNGVIATDNLAVKGSGYDMLGKGRLMFLDDKADFKMRITAQGLPGVVLSPVTREFEYTAGQKLSKPEWQLK